MNNKNYTIRDNQFDKDYVNLTPIYIDRDGNEHAINKNKNWELLDDPNIKQIKYHRNVMGNLENSAITHKRNPGYSGGSYGTTKKGRDYVTVDGVRQNSDFRIELQRNCIILPFDENEYPINREPHILHDSPCKGCFRSNGRIWQLKGLGDKSINKNKGMKKEQQKNFEFYHDY